MAKAAVAVADAEPAKAEGASPSKGDPAKPSPPQRGKSAKKLKRKPTSADLDNLLGVQDAVLLRAPPKIPTYRQGDRVVVGGNEGVVQYVGDMAALGSGLWVGVQFDDPVGTADPKQCQLMQRLFACPPKHSGFHRPAVIAFTGQADRPAGSGPPPPSRQASAATEAGSSMHGSSNDVLGAP